MKKVTFEEAKELIKDQSSKIVGSQVIDKVNGDVIAEITQEEKAERNKVIEKVLFMGAKVSGKGDKIGISILRYDSLDKKTGQVFSSKDAPYVTSWIAYSEDSKYKKLLGYPVLKEVYVALSGDGSFVKLHNIFTDEEAAVFAQYM